MPSLVAVLTIFVTLIGGTFSFRPETGGLQYERLTEPIQLRQELGASQGVDPKAGNSWWSSSYLHASDDHDYLIVSHASTQSPTTSTVIFRASILDINDTTYYRQVSWKSNSFSGSGHVQEGPLNGHSKYFGFAIDDPANLLGPMRTWCISDQVEFNITFELSAPIILNGGIGTFPFGNEVTFEWSMPAGITNGYFVKQRKILEIDNARSMTWYDRQLIWPSDLTDGPVMSGWTWFELHVDELKLSIWIWDTFDGRRFQFATVREEPGVHQVVAVTQFTPSSHQWTSPVSDATYSLEWVVSLADGTSLKVSSVREDQEIYSMEEKVGTYEGYVEVTGTRDEHTISGYGLVEIIPASIVQNPS
ncbi:hypothetical protein BDV23DRAFT_169963 [Aspergillus alliaceus]|uniref:Uncharacterized protein n=1 Tax=Petromyces alliaceus TaxID=209559 RepID=A0A5N7CI13_PETAA|nr:uncharacterized protein BDW43DRAFT_313301 [Aspergillus alliaceus]KAB8231222.1 hypothetical protein BDW43DRAFT_313301 [Aspergillus alliaceus]KAE8393806.1 hypothetical protein BDV23DRAFT_169963 [Aspergillus alliaceus]